MFDLHLTYSEPLPYLIVNEKQTGYSQRAPRDPSGIDQDCLAHSPDIFTNY